LLKILEEANKNFSKSFVKNLEDEIKFTLKRNHFVTPLDVDLNDKYTKKIAFSLSHFYRQ